MANWISEENKRRLAEAGAERGIPAPEGFLQALEPVDDTAAPRAEMWALEQAVQTLKSMPEFDLKQVLSILIAEELPLTEGDLAGELAA